MKFNVNDYVKVKLTKKGLEILKEQHAQLQSYYHKHNIEFDPPSVDEDGYSSFQMHYLMNIFGPGMLLGCEVPFETEIIIED